MTERVRVALYGWLQLLLALAAVAALFSSIIYAVARPHLDPFFQMAPAMNDMANSVEGLAQSMIELSERVASLEAGKSVDKTPPLQFAPGGFIGDGRPGDTVEMRLVFHKVRDCGAPIVDAFMQVPISGPAEPLMMRFTDVGVVNPAGRGPNLALGPGRIAFPVTIPPSATVGPAIGWIDHTYPECPAVGTIRTPQLPFQVLPRVETTQR